MQYILQFSVLPCLLCFPLLWYALLVFAMLRHALLCFAMLCLTSIWTALLFCSPRCFCLAAMLCDSFHCFAVLSCPLLCNAMPSFDTLSLCFALPCCALRCFAMLGFALPRLALLCYVWLCCFVDVSRHVAMFFYVALWMCGGMVAWWLGGLVAWSAPNTLDRWEGRRIWQFAKQKPPLRFKGSRRINGYPIGKSSFLIET